MRSDAEQNRARILEVARTALSASSDATLNSIAKLAGVGQGTMYRHFPSREALLLAVYRRDVQAVIDAAPALLAAYPPRRCAGGSTAWPPTAGSSTASPPLSRPPPAPTCPASTTAR
jgi:AcrR family transcriptional regulator